MKPLVWTWFLALVGGLWLVKELAPVVLIPLGDLGILLFALIRMGTSGGLK